MRDGRVISAHVQIPGSKSLTNRYLVLEYLAKITGGKVGELKGLLKSRDTNLMQKALETLANDDEERQINCGLAGTVMRFVPPLAMLTKKRVKFDGDEGAKARPMGPVLDALEALGTEVIRENGDFLPFTVWGKSTVQGGYLEIDASTSSQFVSALLLSAPAFENGIHLVHTGSKVPSLGHIDMTIDVLQKSGVNAQRLGNKFEWKVAPGKVNLPNTIIEPDLSNAGPFLAAALANPAGGKVYIPFWPKTTTQVGAFWEEILPKLGATVSIRTNENYDILTVSSDGKTTATDLDLSIAGELTPTVVALLTLVEGQSKVTGIGNLRGHETDRLQALVNEITKLGRKAYINADGDGITIEKMTSPLRATTFESYNDHRMATFGAIIGLRVPNCEVLNIATTAKTMPDFPAMWAEMLEGEERTSNE